MAHDEDLAVRIRALLDDEPGVEERRMFGGLAFLVDGHIAVAASGRGGLMARVDPAEADGLLDRPHCEPFEMRGRPIEGWIRVAAAGVETDDALRPWVARGLGIARSLPPR